MMMMTSLDEQCVMTCAAVASAGCVAKHAGAEPVAIAALYRSGMHCRGCMCIVALAVL
jgi:hypothetical protein